MDFGIGIVGTGVVAEVHARAIERAKGVRLVSVLSRSPEKAAAFAARHSCAGHSDSHAFLADKALDVVSICTPPGGHVATALEAISSGRHVLVEKPLEVTLEGCDAIIEAAARKGVRAGGIFQSRFYDAPRFLKAAVDEGRFGRLILGDAYVKWLRTQEYYDAGGWKGKGEFGGGALMNQAIHAIDLLQWYMGPVESAFAFTGTLGHERLDAEDTAVAALRFARGGCGVIEATTATFPGFLKRIDVCGTSGSVVLEEEDIRFWKFSEERPDDERIRATYARKTVTGAGVADPAAISVQGHCLQYEDFAAALREGRAPAVDAVEARKSIAIILALYRSAETGRPERPSV